MIIIDCVDYLLVMGVYRW